MKYNGRFLIRNAATLTFVLLIERGTGKRLKQLPAGVIQEEMQIITFR